MPAKFKTNAKGDVIYTKEMKKFRKIFDPPTPAWLLKAAGSVATAIGVKKPKNGKQAASGGAWWSTVGKNKQK
jgi:hypothetical protein